MLVKRSATEKAAWITAGSAVIVAIIYVFGAPMYEERPIAQVSFGLEKDYPLNTLQKEGDNYYIDTYWYNTGKGDVFSILSYTGTNVKLSNNVNGPWQYQTDLKYWIESTDKLKHTKIFVSPDLNANQFTITFEIKSHPEQNPFQKLTLIIPSTLTYEKSGSGYTLIDTR